MDCRLVSTAVCDVGPLISRLWDPLRPSGNALYEVPSFARLPARGLLAHPVKGGLEEKRQKSPVTGMFA